MIRILIIEDSLVTSTLLSAIFNQEADMTVVGCARNGAEGVKMAEALQPDLITMDIRMPIFDGFAATQHIMATRPVPIVVISSSVNDEELRITFRAIEEGALAVIEKPAGLQSPNFSMIRSTIVETIRTMAGVKLVRRIRRVHTSPTSFPVPIPTKGTQKTSCQVLALACSTGGPQALHTIFAALPQNLPFPIVVVQHISPGFIGGLVKWLAISSKLTIKLAENGELLRPGTVFFAPDNHHLTIGSEAGQLQVQLCETPPVNRFRPSGNPLFNSLATVAPHRSVGGILTGMGNDGVYGLLAMRNAGCHTFAQDRESSIVFGMPGEALALNAVETILSLERIPDHILSLINRISG
ncbi:MAG: chemotaxis-specific protein-glutamate methyltransferase CheB [Magnetococcales bacterium]|nr:chemotaxis-specific protein-glutamate methyltransferase CheB [Magnetococcales bacterium]